MKLHEHTVTLRIVAPTEWKPPTSIADVSYMVTTHGWQLVEMRHVRSRTLTRDEASAIKLDWPDDASITEAVPAETTQESPS